MRIALVNVNCGFDSTTLGGKGNPGLTTLEDSLIREGHKVKLFPERDLPGKSTGTLDRLAKNVIAYNPEVVGISCLSEFFSHLIYVGDRIKQKIDVPIIGGGKHFRFDYFDTNKGIHNSVINALLKKKVVNNEVRYTLDGVVVGEGKPFIELVRNFKRNMEVVPEGFYAIRDDKIYVSGVGKFPEISRAPYSLERAEHDSEILKLGKRKRLYVLGNPKCVHRCDYCVNYPVEAEITPDMVLSSIVPHRKQISRIDFADPCPFLHPGYYKEVFKAIRGSGVIQPMTTYLDPSVLMLHKDGIYKMIQEYNIFAFFIGRETISEESAKAIGRNYLGKPRSQERLDAERIEILHLLEYLGTLKGNFHISVAYIFSPFDSPETIIGDINELIEFKKKAPSNVMVVPTIGYLKPYPGTEIRKKYIDHVVDPNGFLDRNAYKWDPKKFPEYTKFREEHRELRSNVRGPITVDILKELRGTAKLILK